MPCCVHLRFIMPESPQQSARERFAAADKRLLSEVASTYGGANAGGTASQDRRTISTGAKHHGIHL